MSKKFLLTVFLLLGLVLTLAACGGSDEPAATEAPTKAPAEQPAATEAPAEQPTEAPAEQPTEAPAEAPVVELFGDSLRGGRLYDAWFEELGVDAPESDQPLWATQSSNSRSGKDTWRCKECHGWDYQGVDGAYGSGSHTTGFAGILDLAGTPAADVLAMLQGSTNPDHDFSAVMDEQALTDLALFISEEMASPSIVLDLTGDEGNGQILFEDTCEDCHGPEGLAINFHTDAEPEYPATIANDNPMELLAKVRFGQPDTEMPSAIDAGWTNQEMADAIAYVATLPQNDPVAMGGRMYDNWMKALSLDVPEGDQPLWATQDSNSRSGADTWRCKECHGWDYQGADGVYASGSHATGFPGIFAAQDKSADEIVAVLTAEDHDFSQFMSEDQIGALVAFIQEGMIDKTQYINADKTLINGDADAGEALFSECAECHGIDGTDIDFADGEEKEFVGSVASDNPWEFMNKASFSQPGEQMPAGLRLGFSWEDIVNLTAYAQTLPTE